MTKGKIKFTKKESLLKVIIACFILLQACDLIQMEIFTALSEIVPLIETQKSIIDSLKEYVTKEENKLNIIKQHLNMYEMEHEKATEDVMDYLQHPINTYSLIRRLTTDLHFIENLIKKKKEFNKNEDMLYPNAEDLNGAVEALLRLQSTYKLNVTQLADGIINTSNSQVQKRIILKQVTRLRSSDCYNLGIQSHKDEDIRTSVLWLLEALYKYEASDEFVYNITDEQILRAICNAYSSLGYEYDTEWCSLSITPQPERYRSLVKTTWKYLTKSLSWREKYENQLLSGELVDTQDELDNLKLNALCRGEVTTKRVAFDKCYYTFGPHPFLRLARVRTELLHRAPEVLLFHDVLSNVEIQHIQETAQPNVIDELKRAKIRRRNFETESHIRVCKVAVLDKTDEVLKRLLRRMSLLTSIDLISPEKLKHVELQASEYGIGGYFLVHEDFSKELPRIATVVFYLSDVNLGGATAFIDLGISMLPQKGSALFWRNLIPPNTWNNGTKHGACPVLHGFKWVLNMWTL